MTLEDQIKALLEAKKDDATVDADKQPTGDEGQETNQADRVDAEPAVKIENPMDPNLTSSEVGETPEEEIAAAEAQGKVVNEMYGDSYDNEFQGPADAKTDGVYRFAHHDAFANRYGQSGKVCSTKWCNAVNDEQGKKFFDMHMDASSKPAYVVHHAGNVYQAHMTDKKFFDANDTMQSTDSDVHKKYGYIFGDSTKVEESIGDLLGSEFSDEFKLKAQTIFEAAVKDQVSKIEARLQEEQNATAVKLQEEFEQKLITHTKILEEETSDKIDGYLSFLAEEWKKDNEIALEAAIKTELTESFIKNLKTVFESHYIDLPDDKVDLYNKTLAEKTEVETALATTVASIKKLTEELNAIKREQIIEESVKDFSTLDQSRFKTLTEDFAFEDADTFKTKVDIVKKSFFGQKSVAKEQLTEELVKQEPIVESSTETVIVDEIPSTMKSYLKALSKK